MDSKKFVETRVFTARLKKRMSQDEYRRLQNALLADPERGKVMPGCGGLRKVRFAEEQRGKGSRGGVRVIYLHIPAANRIDFMTIYDKGEKENLSADDKKVLRQLADQARKEAAKAYENIKTPKGAQKRFPKKER